MIRSASVVLALGFVWGCSAAGASSGEPEVGSGGSSTDMESTGGATGIEPVDAAGGSGSGLGTGGAGTGGLGMGTETGTGGESQLPPLEECGTASIDRLQEWLASGEGPTTPATGSLLVPDGNGYVAQATFNGAAAWHVLAIWFGNEFGASIDFTGSAGFTLTYSATADFYFQLRPAGQWSGGAKWHMPIPATGGMEVTTFFPFEASAWEVVEVLGTPPHTLAEAMADASGFAVVGNEPNQLSFRSLRIDGFTPTCL